MLGLADYLKCKDDWLSDIGAFRRTQPEFGRLFYVLRLACESCATGYMVVRKRSDRKYRFAGCSTYQHSGCDFTLGSRDYARRKSETIIALLCGVEPQYEYLIRERPAT